jgi:signal transduction histidine kinase
MSEHLYTILVVDDEVVTRKALAALIKKPNYRVEMAEDGIQGIEMARQFNPDVILLDVMMPRMNGYDVCKHIRADPQIGEVPIIMITALDDREAKLDGLMVGADDFLTKPFDCLELEIRLNSLLRVSRYRHLVHERERLKETLAELATKNKQLQSLSQQTLDAQENERRHVAVELHDEIGQLITGLKLILERKGEDTTDGTTASRSQLAEARAVTNELLQRVREISLDLRPAALDDFGLSAALDDLFKRFSSRTKISIHHNANPLDERRYAKTIETTVFRVVQEALTNIARHAGVKEASVSLIFKPDLLRVSITDTGLGFDLQSKEVSASTGLSGMKERVQLAGGRFALQSAPGEGTLVLAEFDLKPTE